MCPVCYYENMLYPAKDYNICPCCGTEFENDDEDFTHEQLRQNWTDQGAKWFFREPPPFWNPWQQLAAANVPLPYATTITFFDPKVSAPRQGMMFVDSSVGATFYSHVLIPQAGYSVVANTRTNFEEYEFDSPKMLAGEIAGDVLGVAA